MRKLLNIFLLIIGLIPAIFAQEHKSLLKQAKYALQIEGNFKLAAALYAKSNKQKLSLQLLAMAEEEHKWQEPGDFSKLLLNEQIDYHIYHLRNINIYTSSYSISPSLQKEKRSYNPIKQLVKIGDKAIPKLLPLLKDSRPTRFMIMPHDDRERGILFYKDIAMEILDEILPAPFYHASSTMASFSTETAEMQGALIKALETWWSKSEGKAANDKKWIALNGELGIYSSISILTDLAKDKVQIPRVRQKLNEMIEQRHPFQAPQISLLMCSLGDQSQLKNIAEAYFNKKYKYAIKLPDDSSAGGNAEEYAVKQILFYGDQDLINKLKQKIGKQVLYRLNHYIDFFDYSVPEDYPFHLLSHYLNSTELYYHSKTLRECDIATAMIETIQNKEGKHYREHVKETPDIDKAKKWLLNKLNERKKK